MLSYKDIEKIQESIDSDIKTLGKLEEDYKKELEK